MTEEPAPFPSHPIRAALLELLRERGAVTSTEAAKVLGGASGLYSFHLRQLARYGLVEEAPARDHRARPWQLTTVRPQPDAVINRELGDESYQRWLATKSDAPAGWQVDDAFSQVLYLTPAELTALGASIRELIQGYRYRESRPSARPAGAGPVAVVSRLFPLTDPT